MNRREGIISFLVTVEDIKVRGDLECDEIFMAPDSRTDLDQFGCLVRKCQGKRKTLLTKITT